MLELMRAYASRGHDCRLAYREAGVLSESAAREGSALLRIDLSPRRIPAAAGELSRYCRENGVDVIHAQYPRENVIAVLSKLRRSGARVVFTAHLTTPPTRKWRFINRFVTRGDDAVIAVCGPCARLLALTGVRPDRIRVIPNGVPVGPPYPRQDVIRREFGLDRECFIFITLARYAPEKGLEVLLEAVSLLRERVDRPFVCLIAGEGELYGKIGEEIDSLSLQRHVIREGFRKDTAALLCSADAFVSPSVRAEAMSFSILEAMRCGLPLAVTDVGAGSELAEGCGYAVPPGDADALAEAMLLLMTKEEERERFGVRAYEKVIREYSLEKTADETFLSYKK